MAVVKKTKILKRKCYGKGLLNSVINKIPFEMHLPGYQYCGPGTKLAKRVARGDKGINPLDAACKDHDISYTKYSDGKERSDADRELLKKAWKRVKSRDASLAERAAALAVSTAMKGKLAVSKLGKGLPITKKMKTKTKTTARNIKKPKCCSFKNLINSTKRVLRNIKPKNADKAVNAALIAARRIKEKNLRITSPRIIPVPKQGGMLPLIPIFAGLSALGSLIGGTSGIIRAVGATNQARKQLTESERHNKTMEAIAIGKSPDGRGLYLKPYRSGFGLYLKPYKFNEAKNF